MLRAGLIAAALAAGCGGVLASTDAPGGSSDPSASGAAGGSTPLPPDVVEPGGTGPAYPGTGFRVHEWGTNTVVVGSDGSMQRGLHHEEEDLPSFVYDRARSEIAQDPTDVKMETPVTYFYSDAPLTASAKVAFPKGVFTQWYPRVAAYAPVVLKGRGDPVLDRDFPYSTPACRETFSVARDGLLDWGRISILGRDVAPSVPPAALDRYTWSHARAVAANAVRVEAEGASQDERFLFYRGLGNFPLGVKVSAQAGPAGWDGGLALANLDGRSPTGAVFILRVEKDKAAFAVHPAGIAAGETLSKSAPPATQSIDAYVQDLAKAMVVELDKAGLYHDESIAMVKTWARQWFRTPGVRVLYLAPRSWTDAQIPLTIEPAPVELVRVMVIRVEALTPAQEDTDVKLAALFGSESTRAQAEAHFAALGRFAEPRLRRALALIETPSSEALAHLDAISGADVAVRAGE